MRPELYEQFVALKNVGKKKEARYALNSFIASFESFEEKRAWTKHFLKNEEFGHKIRHELYEQIIFPVLLEGYEKKDAWSTSGLARTSKNFYANESLFAQLRKIEFDLLKEAYALEPSEEVRQELLKVELRWFSHCQHEWPAGILYGNDGATSEECEQIVSEIAFARTLDAEAVHTSYLDDYENKVRQYIERLQKRHQK